ncbi:MAG: hypothetical protein AAB215_00620 [Planctomycetota bacterium]
MVELGPDDFIFLNEFPLAMRWADPNTRVLWVGAVDAIRPVVREKGRAFWDWSMNLLAEAQSRDNHYERPLEMGTYLAPKRSVLLWLGSLGIEVKDAYISWDPDLAGVTDWEYFMNHWDAYCRKGDNLLIWDIQESWSMLFEETGKFMFARRRETARRAATS